MLVNDPLLLASAHATVQVQALTRIVYHRRTRASTICSFQSTPRKRRYHTKPRPHSDDPWFLGNEGPLPLLGASHPCFEPAQPCKVLSLGSQVCVKGLGCQVHKDLVLNAHASHVPVLQLKDLLRVAINNAKGFGLQ